MKHIGLVVFFFWTSMAFCLNAPILTPEINLTHLKVLKTAERGGDELYFDLAIYRPNHQLKLIRVPAKPIHIPSSIAEKFFPSKLWTARLENHEANVIILSLIESDDSPINPDDVLGSVRLVLKNEDGKLKTNWSEPNVQESDAHKQTTEKTFNFNNLYEVSLSVNNLNR